ncbi:MAG: DUF3280 domain-containing protein [Burkholderiaceae bacterium]|nr:DUF3280 domain-containing protein [Burkholderiaceae bacterium]
MNPQPTFWRSRRWTAVLAAAVGALTWSAAPAQDAPRRLLLLDFELIDEQRESVPFPEASQRLAMIGARLRQALVRERLYEVVDETPVAEAIRRARREQNILNCNGCELELARQAGAERVMLGWVQKVSNLILNINVEVRDVRDGRTVLVKSVDLRGNTDASWQRGIDMLVRDIVEKRQAGR